MNAPDSTQLVLGLYKAFDKADTQTVLDSLADEVEWIEPGGDAFPWAGTWRGVDQVKECFRLLNEKLAYQEAHPNEVFGQEDTVVCLGTSAAVIKANGVRVEHDWAAVWSLEVGKVKRYQLFYDTAQWAKALLR